MVQILFPVPSIQTQNLWPRFNCEIIISFLFNSDIWMRWDSFLITYVCYFPQVRLLEFLYQRQFIFYTKIQQKKILCFVLSLLSSSVNDHLGFICIIISFLLQDKSKTNMGCFYNLWSPRKDFLCEQFTP